MFNLLDILTYPQQWGHQTQELFRFVHGMITSLYHVSFIVKYSFVDSWGDYQNDNVFLKIFWKKTQKNVKK